VGFQPTICAAANTVASRRVGDSPTTKVNALHADGFGSVRAVTGAIGHAAHDPGLNIQKNSVSAIGCGFQKGNQIGAVFGFGDALHGHL
jgi:hypothetical protein